MTDSATVSATILDGKAAAAEIRADLAVRVARLREQGIVPGLGTVLVGDDPGSRSYVAGKHRDCAEVGLTSLARELPATATQADVEAVVDELNADPACTGYIVQLPLPAGLDSGALLTRMDPAKDADGLHPTNLGRLVLMEDGPLPCTPRGIVRPAPAVRGRARGRRRGRGRPRRHRRAAARACCSPGVPRTRP